MSRRAVVVALWLAAIALCAWQVLHTRFVADLSLFLPSSPTPAQRLLVEQLRDGALSRLVMVGISGGDAAERARLSNAVADALRKDTRFAFAGNGTGGFERERGWLMEHRYVLSPNVTPERFSVAGLRAAIDETIDLLASPAGLLVKALVPRDPTGEMLAVLEAMRPGSEPRKVEGVWASPDGNRAILLARTRASGSDIDAQADAMSAIEAAFGAAQPRAASLEMTGLGVFAVRSRALVRHDVERLALVSLGLVAAILLVVYRSPTTLLLGLVPVASGALAGVAAVSLGFGAVHGITLGFGTTLIGEAVDYSIYLFVQSERANGMERGAWIARFWPTVRLGVLTSIAGFSALLFSGLPGLAQLGVYSIAGLVAAAAVTRFVLPRLLPAGWRIRDLTPWGVQLARTVRGLARGRWIPAVLATIALGILAAHWGSLSDRDLANLNPIGERDRRLDVELRAALGASDARHMIVVAGADEEAVLEQAERVGRALDPLVASRKLGGYDSPARFLPSLDTQRKRRESLPETAELRSRLQTALAGSPLRPGKLEPFVGDVERARSAAPATRRDIAGTALDAALDGMLVRSGDGRARAIIGLRAPESSALDIAAVQSAIGSVPGTVLLDLKGEVDALYGSYFQRALVAAAIGLAIIVALLFASLRSPGRVARVMAPLVAGVLVVAAGHALAGSALTLLHLVGLLLVVAIGSNYALFFDRLASTDAPPAPRTLASLVIANATTVASFGVLAASSIPVLHALGATVAPGAFLTLLFAALSNPSATIPEGEDT